MSTLSLLLEGSMLSAIGKFISTPESYLGATTYVAGRRVFTGAFKLATILSALAMIGRAAWEYKRGAALVVILITVLIVLPGCASGPQRPTEFGTEYERSTTIYGADFCSAEKAKFKDLHKQAQKCADRQYSGALCSAVIDSLEVAKWDYRTCKNHYIDTNILTNPSNLFR